MGMRMIDAHDLYDQFLKEMETLVKSTNHKDIDLEAISMLCGAKLITDAPTITPEPGWISVKDRMPDKAGKYLIVALEQGKFQHVTTAYFGRHFNMTGRMSHWRVTHWMPMPEPPKEET